MLASLARSCSQHPWRVLAAWGVVLVVVLGSAGAVGDAFVDNPEPPTSESGDGFDLLDEHFSDLGSGATGSVVFAAEQGVDDPAVTAEMSAVFDEVASIDGVTLSSPYDEGGQRLVSASGDAAGTIAYAELRLDPELSFSETSEIGVEIDEIIEDLGVREVDGLQVEIGGQALGEFEPPESEALGLAFAVIVLILATGSVVAMGTSIGVALAGVGDRHRAHRAGQQPDRRAVVRDDDRRDDRHRGRHRLRAVHHHPLPRGVARRSVPDRRDRRRARHVGPFGALRRHDRRHLAAGAAARRAAVRLGSRHRSGAHGVGGDGVVGDAAARGGRPGRTAGSNAPAGAVWSRRGSCRWR